MAADEELRGKNSRVISVPCKVLLITYGAEGGGSAHLVRDIEVEIWRSAAVHALVHDKGLAALGALDLDALPGQAHGRADALALQQPAHQCALLIILEPECLNLCAANRFRRHDLPVWVNDTLGYVLSSEHLDGSANALAVQEPIHKITLGPLMRCQHRSPFKP